MWTHLMEMRNSKRVGYFHMHEKEFKQLEIMCDKKYGLLSNGKAQLSNKRK